MDKGGWWRKDKLLMCEVEAQARVFSSPFRLRENVPLLALDVELKCSSTHQMVHEICAAMDQRLNPSPKQSGERARPGAVFRALRNSDYILLSMLSDCCMI